MNMVGGEVFLACDIQEPSELTLYIYMIRGMKPIRDVITERFGAFQFVVIDVDGERHRYSADDVIRLFEEKEAGECELKPCRFCGKQPEISHYETFDNDEWAVSCVEERCEIQPATNSYFTREQAIEAWNTLADERGECELHGCEGGFSAVNRPVWRCDCGAFVTQYTDATTYHKPRYCPNCGKAVKR